MGDNSTSGSALGIIKGHNIGLTSFSPSSSALDNVDGPGGIQSLNWHLQRQRSEDSSTADVAEEIETEELQRRLFQQKYKALKVQKEKKKIDRNTRNFGKPREKYFQLPDEVQFALNVACGNDPLPPKTILLPKIVNEGELLFTPDGDVTSRSEHPNENGGTTRREKEVRIVENITPRDDTPSRTPRISVRRPSTQNSDKQKILTTPKTDVRPKPVLHTSEVTDNNQVETNRKGSGKRTTSAASHNSRVCSGKSTEKGSKHRGTQHSRISSGNSEVSRTCSRPHSKTTKPCSRPSTSSSTSSFQPRVRSSKRKQSRADESIRRRRSHVASSGTLSHSGHDSDNSDYFDSDSDLDFAPTPRDVNHDVSLYRRACQLYKVVTSRRVEEGLKKGKIDVSFSQLTRDELKVICIAIMESVNISRIDLAGNALPEPCLSYLCEVLEDNKHIRDLNLSECQADREGVGQLVQCLQHKNSLTSLDISGIGLCVEQVRIISEYIQNSSSLQRLCLSYCEVGEAGATILADALGSTICLSYLDLSWNQLRRKGALLFCMALKDNDTIQNLDLSWNGLDRDGCMGLEVALRSNTVLRHLDISSNRIGVLGLECLLKGLHANTTLNSINIGNNPLPTESGTAILETLISATESTLCMLNMSHIAVEDDFLSKLTEIRKSRAFYVYHGHVLSRKKDPYEASGGRSLVSFDPILVLFEYMKLQNMRLIDLFRSIDTNGDKVISRDELRNVFLSLNMSLPRGTFDAMFRKMDLNNDSRIDMDELKLVQRRVMRQARTLKARATKDDEDEFGDTMREFQDLVRVAVARRRSRRGSRPDLEGFSHSPDPSLDFLTSTDSLRVASPGRRRSSVHLQTPSPSVSRRGSGGSDAMLSLRSLDFNPRRSAKSRSGSFTSSIVGL